MAHKTDRQKTGTGDSAGDAAWQRLTKSTNPLSRHSRERHIAEPPTAKTPAKTKAAAKAEQSLAPLPVKMPLGGATTLSDKTKPLPPQADIMPRTRRRLSRGTLAIAARLDLHGLSLAEAELALSAFVKQARAQGHIWLLVITGKGTRGEGKLRRALPDWLARGALAGLVVEYGPAAANHGGTGAYYLRLRRAPRKA